MPDPLQSGDPVDLLLRGARCVLPDGTREADLAVRDGQIVAVLQPGETMAALTVVDVAGRSILPGLIDTHAHLREPGHEHKEDILHGTRAAAAGGYTTVMGMPNVSPPTSTLDRWRDAIAHYEASSVVDFNHHPTPTVLDEIPALAEAGALAFKIYLISDAGRDYLRQPGLALADHGELFRALQAIGEADRPAFVHPHDQALMTAIEAPFHARGERDFRAYARAYAAHEGIVWDTASALVVRLAEAAGVHLHLLHMKTRRMIDIVQRAKAGGQRLTCELNPVSLLLANDWANIERLGPYALSTWIGDDETDALYAAVRDGTIDVIGTDHAPHTRAEKEVGWTDMWKASGGLPHLQETLGLFLTEVNAGRLELDRLVEITSTGPARLLGIHPRKGAIVVGADADLVVVDLDREHVFRTEEVLSKCGWTAFDGQRFHGVPVQTWLRGTLVYDEGEIVGAPGGGRLVTRSPVGAGRSDATPAGAQPGRAGPPAA
jgi:dihydroorotase